MTKLEAWNTWLMMTHSDTSGDVFTLNHSITGKAFSFGWDQAMVAISERLKDLNVVLRNKTQGNVFDDEVSIRDLPLTPRSRNALLGWGVKTLGDLLRMDPRHLRRIHNLGAKSIKDVEDVLARMNLKVGGILSKVEAPVKVAPVFKKKRVNHDRHAHRRIKIYQAYTIKKLGVTWIAKEFGITVSRVYQIVKRVEAELRAQAAKWPNPILSAKSAAGRMEPPPWLLEKEVQREPNHD
jgi:hypothetical protein